MKRLVLIALLALAAGVGGGLAWFLNSEAGLRWTLELAREHIPGKLAIEHAGGRLSGPIVVTGLRYEGDGVHASAERIYVEWYPWELFSRRLHVQALEIDGLDLELEATEAGPGGGEPATPIGLPIEVYLERFAVRGARIQTPAGPPLDLDAVRIETLGVLRDSASIAALHVAMAGPVALLVDGSAAQLPLTGRGAVAAELRFAGRVEGHRVAGELTADGTTADLAVAGTLAEPVGVQVTGQADIEAPTPEWSLSARLDGFPLDDLVAGGRPLQVVSAALEAAGSGTRLDAAAEVEVGDPEFGRWQARADANLDGDDWSLPLVRVEQLGGPARIHAQAESGAGDALSATVRWETLAWPPSGDALVTSPSGALEVAGTVDRYSLRLDATVAATGVPSADVALSGAGDPAQLRLDALDVRWLDGTWTGGGEVGWSPIPRWDIAIEARGLRPEALHPALDGELGARIVSTGSVLEDGPRLTARIEALHGDLLGRPVAGHLEARVTPEHIDIETLDLASGEARVTGRARIGESWDIDWHVTAPDLAALVPGLSGALRGNGAVAGPPGGLHAAVELRGEDLAQDGQRIGTLAVDADVDLAEAGNWRGTVVAEAVRVAGLDAGRVSLATDGTTADHALALRIDHPDHVFVQQARGSLAGNAWQGVLREGRASHDAIGTWIQRGEAPLAITRDGSASLGGWCLGSGPSALCASGARSATGAIAAALDWEDLDIERLASLLPGELPVLTGTLDGGATLALGSEGRLDGRVEAEARDGALLFDETEGAEAQRLPYRRIAIEATTDTVGARADLAVHLADSDFLTATVNLPGLDPRAPELGTQALQGAIEAQIEDFSALAPFIPALQLGTARAAAGVALGGTVLAPRLEGEAELTLSSVEVVRIGAQATDLHLRAHMTGDEVTIDGDGRMGDGAFQITGGGLLEDGHWSASLGVQGDDLQVLRLPALQLTASPRLAVRVSRDELVFNGTVIIPKASIEPVLPETAITASSDVIVIGQEETQDPSAFRARGQIEIILGDAVTIEGRGFEGRLAGRLLLLVPRQEEILAQGEIRFVDGRYRAYGQNLAIRQGRVLYAGGPVDNPAIDVIASRMRGERNEIEVGVRVTGTALSPFVELYSSPAMDEADILSYIIIGRPIDEAGEGEGVDLYQAAASVAIAGGEVLAERIGERFDLVEISIESGEETDDTALVLGRAVSSRLYVRYIHGILDDTSAVQLRYDLDQNWAIETESGTRSGAGADITYTVDR